MKKILFWITAILLFSTLVSASITFEKIRVEVDGDKDTLSSGESIRDVKPGSNIEFEITLRANDSLEDVHLEVLIEDIGNDLEQSTSTDLRANENKKRTLKFTIPLNVEEGNYDVIIDVDGYEKDSNKRHENKTVLTLEIEKEDNEVQITSLSLSKTKLSCTDTTTLELDILNTGSDDQDLTLSIYNHDLGLQKTQNFNLEEDKQDSFIYQIKVNNNHGDYPIAIRLFNDEISILESIDLEVDCQKSIPLITTVSPLKITYPEKDNSDVLMLGMIVLMLSGLVIIMSAYLLKSKS